jgi:hypothetical protein
MFVIGNHVVCIQFVKFSYTDYGSSRSWQLVDVSEDILRLKQEIDIELHGEDQTWIHNDSAVSPSPSAGVFSFTFLFSQIFTRFCFIKPLKCNFQVQGQVQGQTQAQNRYAETDNRDWRARSAQPPSANEEKSWDNIREAKEAYTSSGRQQEQANRQDQLSSQFASKAQVHSKECMNTSTSYFPRSILLFHYLFSSLHFDYLPVLFIFCIFYFALWSQHETDLASYQFTTNACLTQLFLLNFVDQLHSSDLSLY